MTAPYDHLTTVSSPGFEWLAFICEHCGVRVPVWRQIQPPSDEPRHPWLRRRYCSECAPLIFARRSR